MREVVLATGAPVADFDLLVVCDLTHPLPIRAAEDLVRRFMLRHSLLRTSILETAGGAPIQRVNSAGAVSIPIHRTDDPFSEELRNLVPGTTFELPFRSLFVVKDETVARIAMRISHVITDASGATLLSDDFTALATEEVVNAASMPVSPSPLDLARFEESEEGQRVQCQSLDHAAAAYRVAPPTMWPSRRSPEHPRFWFGELRSAELLAAMDVLKRELNVTRVGVLAASLAAVTASCAGLQSALLFLISGNRFDPDWMSYHGSLSQEAILHLPIEETARETMRTATTRSMRSLRRARYSPAEVDKVRRAAERRRDVSFDKLGTAVVLNLLPTDVETSGVRSTPTTFEWTGSTDAENLGLYLDAYETTGEFVLGVRIDTGLMSPEEAEARLRATEWLIVSAASRDVAIDELHAHLTTAGQSVVYRAGRTG